MKGLRMSFVSWFHGHVGLLNFLPNFDTQQTIYMLITNVSHFACEIYYSIKFKYNMNIKTIRNNK